MNPFTRAKTPTLFDAEKCRAIRAAYAEVERQEQIAKYCAMLETAETALREPGMAWLAEKVREMGGQRLYHMLISTGYSRHAAESSVDAVGKLLGDRLFALSNIERLERLQS